jgi:very-short-patch-repair endonuclease
MTFALTAPAPKKKSAKSELEEALFDELKLYGLPVPIRQHKFHPERLWKFDFAWPKHKIAIELQGGIYVGGAHSRGAYQEGDYEKLNEAARLGWKVFQFGPSQVRRKKRTNASSKALTFMYDILREEAMPLVGQVSQ